MRIRLINKTRYRDSDLLALIAGAARAVGIKQNKLVEVTYARTLWIHGYATLGGDAIQLGPATRRERREGSWVKLYIPRYDKWCERDPGCMRSLRDEVAAVLVHELMHSLGAEHKDMTFEQRYCKIKVPWAAAIPLREQEIVKPEPRTPKELGAARAERNEKRARAALERAEARVAKLETQLKRARKRLTLSRQRVSYYDRKAAGRSQ